MSTPPGPPETGAIRILEGTGLPDGTARKFRIHFEGREVECFAFRRDGVVHAYVNECRHVAMSLDWAENQFFTEDGAFLLCPTHGALYEPSTGECVAGPPCGRHLHRVPIEERDGGLFADAPSRSSD